MKCRICKKIYTNEIEKEYISLTGWCLGCYKYYADAHEQEIEELKKRGEYE